MNNTVLFSEISSIRGGSGFPESYQGKKSGDYPFIKVSDMNLPVNSRLIFEANNYVEKDTVSTLGLTIFPKDTLVFAKVGAAVYLNKRRLLTRETIIDNNMMGIVPKKIDAEFLYQVMLNIDLAELVQPGALPSINQEIIGKISIQNFNKLQQQKIAQILSTVDDLIEKTQSLIDKYTSVKQGMMADLFTRGIDLSGTPETNKNFAQLRPSVTEAPELYQESELGVIPKGWDVQTIEEVSLGGFKNGYFKDPKLVGNGTKLINVVELYQDFGIDITPDKVERIQTPSKEYEKYKVEVGDLFFTRSSLVLEGIAKSNIVRNLPEKAVFECHVMRLKPNRDIVVPEFLALFTGMPKARTYLMSMAKQVTMTTIAQPDMVGLPVPVPSLAEQKLIVEKIDSIENLIIKETITVNKNKEIKKGLMQDLLTGKVSVN